jgi:hypothetical protein
LLEKIKKFLTMGNIIYTPTKVDHIDFPESIDGYIIFIIIIL